MKFNIKLCVSLYKTKTYGKCFHFRCENVIKAPVIVIVIFQETNKTGRLINTPEVFAKLNLKQDLEDFSLIFMIL